MRKTLDLALLTAGGTALAAACGGPTGASRVFLDNFDSLASAWEVSGNGVSSESGSLRMVAGSGAAPSVTYTLPDPYGPGWEFETTFSNAGGSPCPELVIFTGDERRHAWALDVSLQPPDTTGTEWGEWGLQVGDGGGWEAVAAATEVLPSPVPVKLRVSGDNVTLWVQDSEVAAKTVADAAQEAVGIRLGVRRCKILAGAATFDWVRLSELDP